MSNQTSDVACLCCSSADVHLQKKLLFIPIRVDLNQKPEPELRSERAHQ